MEEQKNEGLSALQESVHFNQGDQTCRGVITIKRILIASFIFVALSVVGKLTSGKFWFEDRGRDAAEIAHLKYKLGHKNETILIYRGIVQNKPEWLELSRVEHQYRTEPFEFVNWFKPDDAVEAMFKLEAWDCLQWVMRQPNWYSCLNENTYHKLVKFTEDLNAVHLKKAAQLK